MVNLKAAKIVATLVALIYATVYGLFTMLNTGGGHGNFVWFLMFMFVEFFGLYFPIMAYLSFGLKTFMRRVVYSSLVIFNLVASSVLIMGDVLEHSKFSEDGTRLIDKISVSSYIVCGVIHFIPTLIFAGILVYFVTFRPLETDDGTRHPSIITGKYGN